MWSNFGELSMLSLSFKDLPNNCGQIFGNGLHQIEVSVAVKILDKHSQKPMALTADDLKDLVFLCDYETGDALSCPWIISDKANDYTKPFNRNKVTCDTRSPENKLQGDASDIVLISKFLSCESTSRQVFAVSIDIPGAGIFNTSKFGTPIRNKLCCNSPFISPKSLFIESESPIIYTEKDITNNWMFTPGRGRTQNNILATSNGQTMPNIIIPVHYDSYYIDVPAGIRNANIHEYDDSAGMKKNICISTCKDNKIYMILAHPFNEPQKTETFGFEFMDKSGTVEVTVDLKQDLTYNEHPNKLCFNQLHFEFPKSDLTELKCYFKHHTWFEFWDTYGNYAQFNVDFADDKKTIKITNRD